MRPMYYLKDGTPIHDTLEWAKLMEDIKYRRVAKTTLPNKLWVSTVWLGLDHSFLRTGPPLIFETMVFRNSESIDETRYSTWAQAKAGHIDMVHKWEKKVKV